MTTSTTIQRHMILSRCEHCGLESRGKVNGDCARCGRTFHTMRWVVTPEWADEAKRRLQAVRGAEADEAKRRRQRLARDIREMLRTGWWGYQIIPVDRRRAMARRFIDHTK